MAARTNSRRASKARRTSKPRPALAVPDYLPAKPAGEYYYVLDIPFHARPVAASLGARYVERMDPADPPNVQGWVYVGASIPDQLRPYLCAKYTRDHWFQQDLNRTAPARPPEPTSDLGSYVLRDDQREGRDVLTAAWSAGMPDTAVCYNTGVGKTVTTLAAVHALPGTLNVLIVAPKGALPGWYQHLRDMGDGGKRWLRITPQSLIQLLSIPPKSRVKSKSRARQLRIEHGVPLVNWDVIIADESHWRGNPESQQARILDKLIGHTNAFAINVSATPGEDPTKLGYLHRGFAYASGGTVRSRLHYDEYIDWCRNVGMQITVEPRYKKLQWEPNPTDARTLHHYLFEHGQPWAVTGSPSDWPQMERSGVPLELSAPEMDAYNTVWAEFERTMKLIEARLQRAARDGNGREASRLRQQAREMQVRYRQKVGIIRAPHVADYIVDRVNDGYQVAVSFEFTNTTLAAAYDALVERGITPARHTGTNVDTREAERIAYQRGETPVILFSTTSSINLHAGETAVGGNTVPRLTVVSDIRWRGIDALQIEGRSQRNGTFAPVRYVYALDTIDEKMIPVMLRRMKSLHTITGRDDGDLLDAVADQMGLTLYDEE